MSSKGRNVQVENCPYPVIHCELGCIQWLYTELGCVQWLYWLSLVLNYIFCMKPAYLISDLKGKMWKWCIQQLVEKWKFTSMIFLVLGVLLMAVCSSHSEIGKFYMFMKMSRAGLFFVHYSHFNWNHINKGRWSLLGSVGQSLHYRVFGSISLGSNFCVFYLGLCV